MRKYLNLWKNRKCYTKVMQNAMIINNILGVGFRCLFIEKFIQNNRENSRVHN